MHYQKRLNPYHRSQQRSSPVLQRIRVWTLGIITSVVVLVILLLLPLWHIGTIAIDGAINPRVPLQKTVSDYFALHRGTLIGTRNIIFLKSSDLKTALQTAYRTDQITIDKDLPNTLIITMADPGASAVFIARGKTYAIDPQGIILGEANHQTTNALTIYDSGASLPTIGSAVVRPEFMQFLDTIQNHDGFRGYRIKYALSPPATDQSTVTIATDKGFRIIIDATADLAEQLARMNRIATHVVGPSKLSTLDYIDLRFKEKVFYKTK